jgi:hypothetical protein
MLNLKSITFGCLLAAAFGAQAQGMVTSAMGTRSELKAYADADGKSIPATLSVKDITFPLKIFETSEAGLVRVKVAEKDVWLDRKQIRIPPELIVTCTNVDQKNATLVSGGIRGANSGCK